MISMKNEFIVDELTPEQVAFLKSSGFPAFSEFVKDPGKYKGEWEIFEAIENGPQVLRNCTRAKQVISVCGRKVESLGQAIRVARDMGFNLSKMTFTVNLENVGDKFVDHVNLIPKPEPKVEGEQG